MVCFTGILCKILVFGIIVLFVLTGFSPLNAVNTVCIDYTTGKCSGDYIDWWPTFHHDFRRTGHLTSKAPDENHLLWSYKIGGSISNSPAIVDDRIYIESPTTSYGDNIHCLNAVTGAKIWSSEVGPVSRSSPTVVNGKLYIGSLNDKVYCLDAYAGDFLWSYETYGDVDSSPAVVDGRVYFGSHTPLPLEAGIVYCLDADTGVLIWEFFPEKGNFYTSPAVVNGFVYVTSRRGTYCLNADTGTELWYQEVGGDYSSPTVVNGYVYFGSDAGYFYCLNATSGVKIWSRSLEGGVKFSSPAVFDGKVYIGTRMGGYLYCFNALNGTKIWSFKVSSHIYSSPAIADYKVFFSTTHGDFYCLNASTGDEIWNYIIGESYQSPAIADGKVYIGTGKLFAFGDSGLGTPSAPEIKGPKSGSPGVFYDFKFKGISSAGKDLYYWIDWGDGKDTGWIGPYESDIEVTESHEWDTQEIFSIQAKVKDTDGLVSGWGRFDLYIPRTRASSYHWYEWLERFPMLERLYNLILT